MILVIDAGNTNIVLGVFEEDQKLRTVSRIATHRSKTEDEYAVEIRDILSLYHIDEKSISGGIISSVVPPLTGTLCRAVKKIVGVDPLVVGPGNKTGLRMRLDNVNEVGSDIIVASVAACAKYPAPCVIVDMGTVTKLIVLDKEKVLCGAVFIPGVRISAEALSEKTAQLPYVSLEPPPQVIGTGTSTCIRSGVLYGHAAAIDGIVDRIETQLGQKCTVIATGGHSRSVYPLCRKEIIFDDGLLLDGLYILYQKNSSKQV